MATNSSTVNYIQLLQKLRAYFFRIGIPTKIVTDNGSQFTATEFEEFCKNNHTLTTPYHLSSNGEDSGGSRIFERGFLGGVLLSYCNVLKSYCSF